ncbi:MAG: CPBP family intramembrane metalloprotease [Flavobacteriales bacterium]|nr:CPBP family intramembrane metalloprotease [Flavobacteriales bacterium]
MMKLVREKYKKYLSVKILVVVIVVVSSVAIMLPIIKLASIFGINVQENTGLNFKPNFGIIFFFFLFGICSILIIWLAQKYIHQKPLSQLGFNSKIGRDLFFGFFLGLIVVASINIIYGISAEKIEFNPVIVPDNISLITYIGYYIYFIIGFIVWNSFIEEFGMRVYPIEKLKNYINPHIIFILMGIIFALGHFITREFDIHYFISLFGFSYVFSLLYFYSRSIWLVVGLHSGANWVNFTFFGTNWKMGALYNIEIADFPTWIYNYTDITIYSILLVLILLLNKKGFFNKHFSVNIK